MWDRSPGDSLQGDVIALEARAACAGLALACTFANSTEFDAALIAARRAAGVYGPKRQRRQMLKSGAGLMAIAAVLALSLYLLV